MLRSVAEMKNETYSWKLNSMQKSIPCSTFHFLMD